MRLDHITLKQLECMSSAYLFTLETFQLVKFRRRIPVKPGFLWEPSSVFTIGKTELGSQISPTSLPGGNSEREPPDSIPNSEVKTLSADGSVGSPHVRVGHCQASTQKNPPSA